MFNERPASTEYIPQSARYVDLVQEGDPITLLKQNTSEVVRFFRSIPSEKEEYRYEAGKWTLRQMMLHISDTERVLSYRALTLARGDSKAVFPNMNEVLFAANTDTSARPLSDIVEEFETVRKCSMYLFVNLTKAQWQSTGSLFGHPVTPLGFLYFIIGHTLHHINVVRERYLVNP